MVTMILARAGAGALPVEEELVTLAFDLNKRARADDSMVVTAGMGAAVLGHVVRAWVDNGKLFVAVVANPPGTPWTQSGYRLVPVVDQYQNVVAIRYISL